jgi:hypothetical protein
MKRSWLLPVFIVPSVGFSEVPLGSRSLIRASSGADRWFEIKSQVHHKLVNSLTSDQLRDLNKESVRGEVGAVVERLILDEALPMTVGEREKLIEEILDEVFGLGPLEPLLKDPSISDIMVNGFDNVYIERGDAWWKPTSGSRTRPTSA